MSDNAKPTVYKYPNSLYWLFAPLKTKTSKDFKLNQPLFSGFHLLTVIFLIIIVITAFIYRKNIEDKMRMESMDIQNSSVSTMQKVKIKKTRTGRSYQSLQDMVEITKDDDISLQTF